MRLIYTLFLLLSLGVVKSQGIYQLWGSTAVGGFDNQGVIFSTGSTGNNFQSRYPLRQKAEGRNPLYSDFTPYNGKLYGMLSEGGSNDKGIIFELDPATGNYKKKIDFYGANGSNPKGSLVLSGNKFYGMTYSGGIRDSGIIFEWDPSTNIFTKKIDFTRDKGTYPCGNLTLYNGKFYGMTYSGGTANQGVIFEWNPATNVYTTKINLLASTGTLPYGNLTWNGSKFFGMTNTGGLNNEGVIFDWDPATNIYTKKIDLSSSIGMNPYGSLDLYNGKLYGLTYLGGSNNSGVIFEYDPTGNLYTKKIDLTNTNGTNPFGHLTLNGSKFYGLTNIGGTNNAGTIFEWDPASNIYTKKQDISSIFASRPNGSLAFYNGIFYGMTFAGGQYSNGVLFQWDANTNTLSQILALGKSSNENSPVGHFVESNGKFFEMCASDYTNIAGAIIEWDPSANIYTKRYDFTSLTGQTPFGSLAPLNGKLYGMTQLGGINFRGVIFEFDANTYEYTKKIDLSDAIGSYPLGGLTYLNGKFYGATSSGGDYQAGVLFEWDPLTNIYTKKIDFFYDGSGTWPMGNTPVGSLAVFNGKLYGMTQYAGMASNSDGVLFEWDPVSNVFNNKFEFSGNNGMNPLGDLTLSNGRFYGFTSEGGTNNTGVIFEWNPVTNVYIKRLDFGGNNGSYPQGNLTESNGKFYAMTKEGGNSTKGILFEWDPVTNILVKKKDFVLADANSPVGNYLSLFRAPVAGGSPGICTPMNTITIDNTNNNLWVAITDAAGDAVAEINANGNNLGLVSTSLYINNQPVREDGLNRLYLDRNLSITPAVQPATPVSIRLYLKGYEFEALKNAYNSLGLPSGINTINDVAIFKNNGSCQATVQASALPAQISGASWGNDYVLTTSIPQFSSFYIANKIYNALPVTLLDFNAVLSGKDGLLFWKTANELNAQSFDIERDGGNGFVKVGEVVAANNAGNNSYEFTDRNIIDINPEVIYYRLRQNDVDGHFIYSKIIALQVSRKGFVSVYPNPASTSVTVYTNDKNILNTTALIIDINGRNLATVQIKDNNSQIDISSLPKGIYFLRTIKGKAVKFTKQ